MDARSSAIRMVAAFFLAMVFPSVSFSGSVYIYGGDFNLPIPAEPNSSKGWMDDAVIEVPDHFTIRDLDVGISLTHTSAFDLQIFLQSPAGTRICLNMYDFEKEFFEGQDYTNTVFDDEAELSIVDANAPFTGSFRPIDELSEFDGTASFGQWRLQIYDAFHADTGTFNHFELIFTTPEPATTVLLILGLGLMRLRRCCSTF